MASMRLCDPLLPAFGTSFGVSTGEAALTVSSFAVTYGLCLLLFGPLGDRFGKFRVISIAVLACTLGNALAGLTKSWEWLIAARCLSGAAAAGIVPLTLAWVGDSVDYQRRQAVLGQVMFATLLGVSFGQWMAGALADAGSWRLAFLLLAVAFFATGTTMVAMSGKRRQGAGAADGGAAYRRKVGIVLSSKWARWILFLTVVEGATAFAGMTFIPSFMHEAHGLSLKAAAGIAALFAAGGLLYASLAGPMVAKLGERGLTLGGATMLGICLMVLTVLPSWHWAMPACVIAGMGFTMLHATLQTHATQMAPSVRGTAVALFGACIFLGQSIGVVAASSIVDSHGAALVFLLCGPVILTIGIGFSWSIGARNKVLLSPEQACLKQG